MVCLNLKLSFGILYPHTRSTCFAPARFKYVCLSFGYPYCSLFLRRTEMKFHNVSNESISASPTEPCKKNETARGRPTSICSSNHLLWSRPANLRQQTTDSFRRAARHYVHDSREWGKLNSRGMCTPICTVRLLDVRYTPRWHDTIDSSTGTVLCRQDTMPTHVTRSRSLYCCLLLYVCCVSPTDCLLLRFVVDYVCLLLHVWEVWILSIAVALLHTRSLLVLDPMSRTATTISHKHLYFHSETPSFPANRSMDNLCI